MTKANRMEKVRESLIRNTLSKARCIIVVNNKTKTYECLEMTDFFKKIIAKSGTLEDLFHTLFLGNKMNGEKESGGYLQFMDLSVFEIEQYRANLHFIEDGKDYVYGLVQSRMNEEEVSIVIMEQDNFFECDQIEKEKIDAIQESLLFSMIVDLAEDSCINPNTIEVRADRQDFMDVKYSDWRIMISNMFKEQDHVLFLRASSPENVINTLEIKPRFHIDLQMMNLQGEYIWSRLNFTRMKNFSREHPRFLYTVEDISEDMNQLLRQEGLTRAVEEQNEILQRADEEKTRFFANMSHEFRAPINAIIGMNEIILRNSQEEQIREYAKDIKNASKNLIHLVNDILDFSKIQSGKIEIVPVEYDSEEFIKNVSSMIELTAENKKIDYRVQLENNIPKRLFGDEIRISQVITNLLTNAVKYTDDGSVTLSLRSVKDENGNDAIEYAVMDTGCGIRKEDQEKLFQTFSRFNLERNRRVEGTGLGLGIVTGLLEAMNSSLKVESEYGRGSRFSFVLTQNYVDDTPVNMKKQSALPEWNIDLTDKKILVVDDVPMNLKVAGILLEDLGGCADFADNGIDALDKMKHQEYDIVFLDHMMPELDGVETLRRARELSDYYKDATIVALTANASPTARDEYICMGFTDYLEKPIILEKLEELLKTYIH